MGKFSHRLGPVKYFRVNEMGKGFYKTLFGGVKLFTFTYIALFVSVIMGIGIFEPLISFHGAIALFGISTALYITES